MNFGLERPVELGFYAQRTTAVTALIVSQRQDSVTTPGRAIVQTKFEPAPAAAEIFRKSIRVLTAGSSVLGSNLTLPVELVEQGNLAEHI